MPANKKQIRIQRNATPNIRTINMSTTNAGKSHSRLPQLKPPYFQHYKTPTRRSFQ